MLYELERLPMSIPKISGSEWKYTLETRENTSILKTKYDLFYLDLSLLGDLLLFLSPCP